MPDESDVSRLDQDVLVAGFDELTLWTPFVPKKKENCYSCDSNSKSETKMEK